MFIKSNEYGRIFSEKQRNVGEMLRFTAVHTLKRGIVNIGLRLSFLPQKRHYKYIYF